MDFLKPIGLPVHISLTGMLLAICLGFGSCRSLSTMVSGDGPNLVNGPEEGLPNILVFEATQQGSQWRMAMHSPPSDKAATERQPKSKMMGNCVEARLILTEVWQATGAGGAWKKIGFDHLSNYAAPCGHGDNIAGRLRYKDVNITVSFGTSRDYWQTLKEAQAVSVELDLENGPVKLSMIQKPPSGQDLQSLAQAVNFLQGNLINEFAATIGDFGLSTQPIFIEDDGHIRLNHSTLRQVNFSDYGTRTLQIGLAPITTGQFGSWNGRLFVQVVGSGDSKAVAIWGERHYSTGIQDRDPSKSKHIKLPVSIWQGQGDSWQKISEKQMDEIYSLRPQRPLYARQFLLVEGSGQVSSLVWDGATISLQPAN